MPRSIEWAKWFDERTGKEWRDWLPETCFAYAGVAEDDEKTRDAIMACQVALTNPDAFDVWHCFNSCAQAFNGRRVNFTWLDKLSIPELAVGCTALRRLNPSMGFGDDVLRFIGAAMAVDGVVFFPWVGGAGFALGEDAWNRGLFDAEEVHGLAKKMRKVWESGALTGLQPSDVDPENPYHVQLAELVRADEYVRKVLDA